MKVVWGSCLGEEIIGGHPLGWNFLGEVIRNPNKQDHSGSSIKKGIGV